jgi:hypothetical protein
MSVAVRQSDLASHGRGGIRSSSAKRHPQKTQRCQHPLVLTFLLVMLLILSMLGVTEACTTCVNCNGICESTGMGSTTYCDDIYLWTIVLHAVLVHFLILVIVNRAVVNLPIHSGLLGVDGLVIPAILM